MIDSEGDILIGNLARKQTWKPYSKLETSISTWKHHYQVGHSSMNLETSLLTWKQKLRNVATDLEASLWSWKHHYKLGNIIFNFETPLSAWKFHYYLGII